MMTKSPKLVPESVVMAHRLLEDLAVLWVAQLTSAKPGVHQILHPYRPDPPVLSLLFRRVRQRIQLQPGIATLFQFVCPL